MKIACIAAARLPATTANSIQVMKVAHALAQLGHEVRLFVPAGEVGEIAAWEDLARIYGLITRFEIQWIPTRPAWKRYDLAWKALQQAGRWHADLVYTWTAQAGLPALARRMPVILEVHDRPSGKIGPLLFGWFLRWPGRKRLLVITRALQRILEQRFHHSFLPGQVVIAPNGVDLERYVDLPDPPAARQKLGLREGTTAVYSGHFYSGRGVALLFALALNYPQVNFLWVGGRPEDVTRMRERVASARLQNVDLTGFIDQPDLPLYQAAGEILLMPYERAIAGSSGGNSADICSPMKMFDYLAAGRAILSSDLPVLHEVLNEANAVFCPPEDISAWQAALGRLLDNPDLRAQLGCQARRDASRFTWQSRAANSLEGFK
ncbi:MAG: glycosyltransferase [Chloroflexi bacterium]|nr:glycosyltransferase [Chloroflexota bacterium]